MSEKTEDILINICFAAIVLWLRRPVASGVLRRVAGPWVSLRDGRQDPVLTKDGCCYAISKP